MRSLFSAQLIAGSSEGGAEVFKLDYMGMPGCLAQSPQLYKQMAMMADLERTGSYGVWCRVYRAYVNQQMERGEAGGAQASPNP